MGRSTHFDEKDITNVNFTDTATFILPFTALSVLLINDSLKHDLTYSLNGRDVDGVLKWQDEHHAIEGGEINRLWLKVSDPAGAHVRLEALE